MIRSAGCNLKAGQCRRCLGGIHLEVLTGRKIELDEGSSRLDQHTARDVPAKTRWRLVWCRAFLPAAVLKFSAIHGSVCPRTRECPPPAGSLENDSRLSAADGSRSGGGLSQGADVVPISTRYGHLLTGFWESRLELRCLEKSLQGIRARWLKASD